MTADLVSHSRRGRTHICRPLVTLEACLVALTACGVPLRARVRHAQIGMCWSAGEMAKGLIALPEVVQHVGHPHAVGAVEMLFALAPPPPRFPR